MSKFKVTLEGKNFPIVIEGDTKLYGFYTTRRVRAVNALDAESVAVELVKSDPSLIKNMDLSSTSNPEIFLISVEKLTFLSRLGGSGYTFYCMEEE